VLSVKDRFVVAPEHVSAGNAVDVEKYEQIDVVV